MVLAPLPPPTDETNQTNGCAVGENFNVSLTSSADVTVVTLVWMDSQAHRWCVGVTELDQTRSKLWARSDGRWVGKGMPRKICFSATSKYVVYPLQPTKTSKPAPS